MKPLPSDLSSSRRSQPVRQTRTNPPRSFGNIPRSFGGRDVGGDDPSNEHDDRQQVKYFPAITHFADAITALPRELVRHFTLLKEVDAKIFTPEEALLQLVDAALNSSLPDRRQTRESLQTFGLNSTPFSATGSVNGSVLNGKTNSVTSAPDLVDTYDSANAAWDPENIPRRKLFRQCACTMQEMLVSLDEKNHVISTATEALSKQLSRLEDCFPSVENEISEEARLGSTTHWAYIENRVSKPNDKARREINAANPLSNTTNHIGADEIAARSESRRQANQQKKSRLHNVESDFDDHADNRHRGDSSKKPHGNTKKGRAADVGLGILNGTGTNGVPPPKRRRVEKPGTTTAMERSLSDVHGSNGIVSKGKINSPKGTPVPEGPKKRSRVPPPTNGQAKKKTVAISSNTMSPAVASSPIHSAFADSKAGVRGSPAPTNGGRPSTVRARQNSTQSVLENTRHRASSSASNKQNVSNIGLPDLSSIPGILGRTLSEVKTTMKDSVVTSKGEHLIEDVKRDDPDLRGGLVVPNRRDSTLKREDIDTNGDTITIAPVTTTKSGRASKPSTPAIPQFPEQVRSRSARNVLDQTGGNKRSHKKGAGQHAQLIAAQTADDDAASSMVDDEEDVEIDADEPTYCYCNGVSYGEMVGCDSDGCVREWFHLECVGIKVAPKGNAKWYCDDCKEIMKNSKRFNGR